MMKQKLDLSSQIKQQNWKKYMKQLFLGIGQQAAQDSASWEKGSK